MIPPSLWLGRGSLWIGLWVGGHKPLLGSGSPRGKPWEWCGSYGEGGGVCALCVVDGDVVPFGSGVILLEGDLGSEVDPPP